ncbi:MAG: CoA-binding protein [Desulfobacterales bacterium]|nr:CoA-binding protein [Desulfobacterales bacterium]MDX2510447.1 CoA-binding protein [Desulfobacterales bacterium]
MPSTIEQIESLFHPRSVAIVGLPRGLKTGKLFLLALQDQKFSGDIYPVNPNVDAIDGLKTYPDVAAIPGPVDLAIVLVPSQYTLPVIKACVDKGVKGAILFTAGYRETNTREGIDLEKKIVAVARSGGMRLIGPNGMGFYVPRSGLSFFPELSRKPGSVGMISHSGSLTNILGRMASEKGIYFSKVVSIGNACDLAVTDFLDYFKADPETAVIGAYIEGIPNGPDFLNSLKSASLKKPVVLWKVGLTPEGSQAAMSHTGALAGSREIWQAVIQQGGAVSVSGFEAYLDALMAFSLLPSQIGNRLAILSGPGGLAVSASEACGKEGLHLAELHPETQKRLKEMIPPTGTSYRNPVDVGLMASLDINIYINAAREIARDPGVDAVVVIGAGLTPETNEAYTKGLIQAQKECNKPFLLVKIPGFGKDLARQLCESGLPFFDSAERAMRTYASVKRYRDWQGKQMSS